MITEVLLFAEIINIISLIMHVLIFKDMSCYLSPIEIVQLSLEELVCYQWVLKVDIPFQLTKHVLMYSVYC